MGVDAVIFDWGGTLTPWRNADGQSWSRIAAQLMPSAEPAVVAAAPAALAAAEEEVWRRARVEHRSGTLDEIFAAAGLVADDAAHAAVDAEWEWATYLDPDVPKLFARLRERDIRVGILSNTCWRRARHEQIFVRDGIDHLIDGAVYTSDIAWTKPHPEAFRAAMAAVAVDDPAQCVFVGDRLFDDIHGARQVGMRAVFLPHSDIPFVQRGHIEGEPDATIQSLAEVLSLVDGWR